MGENTYRPCPFCNKTPGLITTDTPMGVVKKLRCYGCLFQLPIDTWNGPNPKGSWKDFNDVASLALSAAIRWGGGLITTEQYGEIRDKMFVEARKLILAAEPPEAPLTKTIVVERPSTDQDKQVRDFAIKVGYEIGSWVPAGEDQPDVIAVVDKMLEAQAKK